MRLVLVGFLSPAMLAWAAGGAALASPPPSASDSLTVEACMTLARERAPDVGVADAARRAALADSAAAGYNRRPSFFLSGAGTVAPPGFYDPTTTDLGGYQLKAGLTWAFSDGGARSRERERAVLEARLFGRERDLASRESAARAAEAALDLVRQDSLEGLQVDAVAWLDGLEERIRSVVRAGQGSQSDAARVQVERDAAEASLRATRTRKAELQRELAELIGWDGRSVPGVVPPGPEALRPPTAADSSALLGRDRPLPEARMAEAALRSSELALEDAERRDAATVELGADAGLAGADLAHVVPPDLRESRSDASLPDRLRRDAGASVSVTVTKPIADPSREASVRGRAAAVEAARRDLERIEGRSRREALDLLGRWDLASRDLSASDGAVTRAEESLLRLRSLYETGESSLLDLLDGRRQVDDVRERRVDAQLDVRLAHYQAEALER